VNDDKGRPFCVGIVHSTRYIVWVWERSEVQMPARKHVSLQFLYTLAFHIASRLARLVVPSIRNFRAPREIVSCERCSNSLSGRR
jgi:hypothetical protein